MTSETQILKELVEAINTPDWWSVIATIIAAIAAAVITYVLGRRQNKLQEQQLEIQKRQNDLQEQQVKLQEQQNELQEQQIRQQEYELYRRMYAQVFELDFFNKTVLLRIVAILTSNEDDKLRLKLLDDIWQDYEKQSKEYSECTLDMELKGCGVGLDAKCYFEALQSSRRVLLMFKYFVENNLLTYDPSEIYNVPMEGAMPPEKLIEIIFRLYIGKNSQHLKRELMAHASIVDKTKQSQLMATIKERITSNDKK